MADKLVPDSPAEAAFESELMMLLGVLDQWVVATTQRSGAKRVLAAIDASRRVLEALRGFRQRHAASEDSERGAGLEERNQVVARRLAELQATVSRLPGRAVESLVEKKGVDPTGGHRQAYRQACREFLDGVRGEFEFLVGRFQSKVKVSQWTDTTRVFVAELERCWS